MSKMLNRINDNRDKLVIETILGKTPKDRCKDCGRYTFYIRTKTLAGYDCFWCSIKKIKDIKEEK